MAQYGGGSNNSSYSESNTDDDHDSCKPPNMTADQEEEIRRYRNKMKWLLACHQPNSFYDDDDTVPVAWSWRNNGRSKKLNKEIDDYWHNVRIKEIEDQEKFVDATEWMYRPIQEYCTDKIRDNGFFEKLKQVGDRFGYPYSGVHNSPGNIDINFERFPIKRMSVYFDPLNDVYEDEDILSRDNDRAKYD